MGKKTAMLIIAALIIIFGVWWFGFNKKSVTPPPAPVTNNQSQYDQDEQNQDNGQQRDTEALIDDSAAETRTGIYVGQIDSNSVEIEISGYPPSASYRAFQLSEELRERWDSLGLQEGDKVSIKFTSQDQQNSVLLDITR